MNPEAAPGAGRREWVGLAVISFVDPGQRALAVGVWVTSFRPAP